MTRRLIKNILALSVLQAATLLLPLATLPYLLRILGPGHFGAYVFCQAIVAYLVLLADYGFNWTATGKVAKVQDNRKAVSRIFWSTQAAKALVAIAGLALMLIGILFVPKLSEMRSVLLATYPLVIGTVLFPQWLFQGLERMTFVTISILSARFLVIPLTFFLVHSPNDTWIAALINSRSMVVAGTFAIILIARNRLVSLMAPRLADVIEAFRDGWHVFISTAAISLYTTTNSVLLGFLIGDAAVGYFGAADKVRNLAQAPLGPLGNALYPRVTVLFAEDVERAYGLVRKSLYLLSAGMLVVSITLWVGSEWIVRIAMGPEYEPAVAVVRWMAFVPLLVSLSNVLGIQMMLPLGMKKKFSEILLLSGVFNIALLIPLSMHYGAQGAAMSVLATEMLVTSYMALYLIKQKIPVFLARTSTDEI